MPEPLDPRDFEPVAPTGPLAAEETEGGVVVVRNATGAVVMAGPKACFGPWLDGLLAGRSDV